MDTHALGAFGRTDGPGVELRDGDAPHRASSIIIRVPAYDNSTRPQQRGVERAFVRQAEASLAILRRCPPLERVPRPPLRLEAMCRRLGAALTPPPPPLVAAAPHSRGRRSANFPGVAHRNSAPFRVASCASARRGYHRHSPPTRDAKVCQLVATNPAFPSL